MMRSLDGTDERLHRMLDVLLEAGRALIAHADVHAALAQVGESVAQSFGGSCEIDVTMHADGEDRLRVHAGSSPDPAANDASVIAESFGDGRALQGTITCVNATFDAPDALVRKAIGVLATELGIVLAGKIGAEREHRVADRLQRALLPEGLPCMSGAEFHAAYRPASDEAEVGGDWFDAFHLPGGRVAISIGDVAGHGLEAAVIMGEIRQAIRTAAVADETPSAVLEYVNRLVALRESIGMVTAIFAIYDPVSSVFSYAVAGHPPPLLAMENGLVWRLPGGSLPLGCGAPLETRVWTFTLPPGAHALFYTDGVIENDRDVVLGERRLMEAVRSLIVEGKGTIPGDPALAIYERVFGDGSNRDDAAVLFLSRRAPVSSYEFSAVPATSAIARAVVSHAMETWSVESGRRFGVLVALGEAFANAIEHAYRGGEPGLIRLELTNDGRQFVLTVEDFGRWRPFVRRYDRGRGIKLMHAYMDGVQIRSARDSTRVILKANLAGEAAPA